MLGSTSLIKRQSLEVRKKGETRLRKSGLTLAQGVRLDTWSSHQSNSSAKEKVSSFLGECDKSGAVEAKSVTFSSLSIVRM